MPPIDADVNGWIQQGPAALVLQVIVGLERVQTPIITRRQQTYVTHGRASWVLIISLAMTTIELPRQSLGRCSLMVVFTPGFLVARLCVIQDLSSKSITREKRQIDGLVFLLTNAVSVLGNFGGCSKGWHFNQAY